MQRVVFDLKPDMDRMLFPRLIESMILGMLIIAGIYANLIVFNIDVNLAANFYITVLIIAVLGMHLTSYHARIRKIRYHVHDDRVQKEGTSHGYISLHSVAGLRIEKNWIDRLFGTATIVLEPGFRLRHIKNYQHVYDYLHKQVQYHR